MGKYMKILQSVSLLGQLGFTLVTPPLLLALLGDWLQKKFDLGSWVMVLAIVIGLLSSATGAYNFCRRVLASVHRRQKTEEEEKPVIFYKHE